MDKLRNFLQSWPGRITMGLIMVPMAFLGIQGVGGSGAMGTHELIKAGDSTIDIGVYQSELNTYRTQLLQKTDASMINEAALSDEVVASLVNRALLQNQAQVLGMTVSDEVISQLIAQDETFHENGQFSNNIFASFLQQNGLTKDELFARFRTQLSVRQLTTSILGTAIYPEGQISRLLDLQLEAREIWVHRLNWQDYAAQVTVTPDEMNAYYNANKDKLVRPESVDLAYVELALDAIKVDTPTEQEIANQFNFYLQKKGMSDGRELAQILLSGGDAEQQAQDIKAKLDKGESFEALAKQYSQDPSGQTGGNIGKYNPAVFGNEAGAVTAALSGLKVGEYTKPMKTSFGYQIFKVVKAGDITPNDVRDELIQMAVEEKRQAIYNELITKINGMAIDGVGIADIAAETKLPSDTIKAYPKQHNQTVLSQPVVVAAAFDDMTIQDQAVSANITLSDKTVWVQPSNHQEAKSLTFAEAETQIKELLTKQKAIKLALAAANTMAETAKASGAKSLMTPSANFGITTRQNPSLSTQERASLFLYKSSENDVWVVETDLGASVLVGGPVATQATAQIPPAERIRAQMMIRDNIGQDQLSDYLQYLKDTTEVTINREALAK